MPLAPLMQVPPASRPGFSVETPRGRVHYLPGGVPSIEEILQKPSLPGDRDGAAEHLLAALRQDNRNLERMVDRLTALTRGA